MAKLCSRQEHQPMPNRKGKEPIMANQEAWKQGTQAQNPTAQKPQMQGDQGKAGQDTDGDGKVVKPGQTPGQSHGKGLAGKPAQGQAAQGQTQADRMQPGSSGRDAPNFDRGRGGNDRDNRAATANRGK
jgi:hypothetical protein